MAAKKAVIAPTTIITDKAVGDSSNSGEHRATKNTPAVTMVAAWIKADTGVGPSIASGSHVCSINCADLPMAPINRSRQIVVRVGTVQPKKSNWLSAKALAEANTSSNCSEPTMK